MNHFEKSFNQIFGPCRASIDELRNDQTQTEEAQDHHLKTVLRGANRKDIVIEALSECSILSDRVLGVMNTNPVGLLMIAEAAACDDSGTVKRCLDEYYRMAGTSLDEILLHAIREFADSVIPSLHRRPA